MSEVMQPISFKKMLRWIIEEYANQQTIFGIQKFFSKKDKKPYAVFDEKCETLLGPAAGPHTQSAQNIVSAYLCGSRYIELKTVQILDNLDIDKPCIEAQDEGYNTEWSTELSLAEAYDEYLKAWILIHILNKMLGLSSSDERNFIFNMSIGYDLEGIRSAKVNNFIENLKDARHTKLFQTYLNIAKTEIKNKAIPGINDESYIDTISPHICSSVTLSTMHGCPPIEQEQICRYLLQEKKLHTFVKLNPTLLGYEQASDILDNLGYNIVLKKETFINDMQYEDAVEMLANLQKVAAENDRVFGVKLSNTLPVVNAKKILPGVEMYMSGRSLYPLTINLVAKLADEFEGRLPISFCGGANYFNLIDLIKAGIKPITFATELLKPGGYERLIQLAELADKIKTDEIPQFVRTELTAKLAAEALADPIYQKNTRRLDKMKLDDELQMLDCYTAPCKHGCPIGQDVPEYIRLINENRFEEAYKLIISKNPLPFITGYICDHNCTLKCVRNDYEESVSIRELKKVAAEGGFEHYMEKQTENVSAKMPKVAVVGAGPCGLSAGYFLAKSGFDITIFDKREKAGGMVRYVIPHFRLPEKAIDNDLKLIESVGVKFKFGIEAITLDSLKNADYQYIILAIGAWQSRELEFKTGNESIVDAIDFLEDFNKNSESDDYGRNIAIIGGGNSAMDSARAAIRTQNAENVHLIYRRTLEYMPADREEFDNAIRDGVQFHPLLSPVCYENGKLVCQKMRLGAADESGRRKPVAIKDEFTEFQIDKLILAIGEETDYEFLKTNGIELTSDGNIKTDKYLQTNKEDVFIGGDAYRGPTSVIKAISDGSDIATAIVEKENKKLSELPKINFDLNSQLESIKQKKAIISPTYDELSSENRISDECKRCLECNTICNKCVEVCPNRANLAVSVAGRQDMYQILHIDALCNECGNCETFCPYQGKPYRDKFTFFSTESELEKSENNGFFLAIPAENSWRFITRIDHNIFNVVLDVTGKVIDTDIETKSVRDFIQSIYKNHKYILL
jgi:putative selenate reductase